MNKDRVQVVGELIEVYKHHTFEYGAWDCVIFANAVVEAITGRDLYEEHGVENYDDVRGAAHAIRAFGKGTLKKTLTDIFGEPVHPSRAWRGDIAFKRRSLGVCFGKNAYFISDDGLVPVPMSEVECVFEVR